MKLSFFNIDRSQSDVIKGLAITFIIFHNFIHWTNNIGENEYELDPDRIDLLVQTIFTDPYMLLNGLFSYFGHYGVELFIFVSGYGLAKQFMKKSNITYVNYLVPRLIKIYGLLIVGFILLFVFLSSDITTISKKSLVISYLLIYNTFSYGTLFPYIYIGPWWYFSLIIQFYFLFPFLYRIIDKYVKTNLSFLFLLFLVYALIYLLYPISEDHKFPIFANSIGHLPEFLFGIYLARFDKFRLSYKVLFLSLIIFALSNKFELFFPLSFLSITVIMLAFSYLFFTKTNGWLFVSLTFMGSISMYAFVINGLIRAGTISWFQGHSALYILLGSVVHFVIVVVAAYILKIIYSKTVNPLLNGLIGKLIKRV